MIKTSETGNRAQENPELLFRNIKIADSYKEQLQGNPLITHRYGADPYAIVYEGRVYLYMSGDTLQYDEEGKVAPNTFGKICTINVISSEDLVNWTDHGSIHAAGPHGASVWGNNSWAPAVAYKTINGITKFFIYFANGGNGIGVLTSDSPTGPFTDPIGKALISRNTKNCADVLWLFDPAVLVDDDQRAYLYFGGGVPKHQCANPGTGRVVELAEDMISLVGEPKTLDIPFLFEDSGINKIGHTYYYSYCSNWQVDAKSTEKLGISNAQIVCMTSDNPMGPFKLQGPILKNPGDYFGCYGTNHHCMFEFQGKLYMAYHTQVLENKQSISGGYRCTHIDKVTFNEDGRINMIEATETGVEQYKKLNPYQRVEAETMAVVGGSIDTVPCSEQSILCGSGNMAVSKIKTGSFICVRGVDFGNIGAGRFTASVRADSGQEGAVMIKVDGLEGRTAGYLTVSPTEHNEFQEITVELDKKICGIHDISFVFYGEGYEIDYWYFIKYIQA